MQTMMILAYLFVCPHLFNMNTLDLRDKNLLKLEKIKEGLNKLKEELDYTELCNSSSEKKTAFMSCRLKILQLQNIVENDLFLKD